MISSISKPLPTEDNTQKKCGQTFVSRAEFEPTIALFEEPEIFLVLDRGHCHWSALLFSDEAQRNQADGQSSKRWIGEKCKQFVGCDIWKALPRCRSEDNSGIYYNWSYRAHWDSVDSWAVSRHVKFWQLSASPFCHSDIPVYLFTHNLSCCRHRLHSAEISVQQFTL
jgi:hypothetical protein